MPVNFDLLIESLAMYETWATNNQLPVAYKLPKPDRLRLILARHFEDIQELSRPRNAAFRILVGQIWRHYPITFSASLLSECRKARHLFRWIGDRNEQSASLFDHSEKNINKHKSGKEGPFNNEMFCLDERCPTPSVKQQMWLSTPGGKDYQVSFSWAHRKPRMFLATT